MTNLTERKGQARGLLLAGLAVLTLALLMGMKYFMRDDTAAGSEKPAERQQLFQEPAAGQPPPGLNPAARSESSGSGGGLDMFSKTNAGYYGADASTAAAAAPAAAPEVKKSTAPAAVKAAAAKPKGTVIPRMKPSSLGTVTPGNVSAHGAGQGMPDISGMLKQAQQQAGKTNSSGN
jgi:hypothetical protein